MNWLSQKIQNVKTALYILDSEAIRAKHKGEQLMLPLSTEPIKEVTAEMLLKQKPVKIEHGFVVVNEAHGGQSFVSFDCQEDFDEFKEDANEFCAKGGRIYGIESSEFSHITKVK